MTFKAGDRVIYGGSVGPLGRGIIRRVIEGGYVVTPDGGAQELSCGPRQVVGLPKPARRRLKGPTPPEGE